MLAFVVLSFIALLLGGATHVCDVGDGDMSLETMIQAGTCAICDDTFNFPGSGCSQCHQETCSECSAGSAFASIDIRKTQCAFCRNELISGTNQVKLLHAVWKSSDAYTDASSDPQSQLGAAATARSTMANKNLPPVAAEACSWFRLTWPHPDSEAGITLEAVLPLAAPEPPSLVKAMEVFMESFDQWSTGQTNKDTVKTSLELFKEAVNDPEAQISIKDEEKCTKVQETLAQMDDTASKLLASMTRNSEGGVLRLKDSRWHDDSDDAMKGWKELYEPCLDQQEKIKEQVIKQYETWADKKPVEDTVKVASRNFLEVYLGMKWEEFNEDAFKFLNAVDIHKSLVTEFDLEVVPRRHAVSRILQAFWDLVRECDGLLMRLDLYWKRWMRDVFQLAFHPYEAEKYQRQAERIEKALWLDLLLWLRVAGAEYKDLRQSCAYSTGALYIAEAEGMEKRGAVLWTEVNIRTALREGMRSSNH